MPYPYEWMKKVTYQEAVDLFNRDKEVYLLFDSGSEALVYNLDEINEHERFKGEYGIERHA